MTHGAITTYPAPGIELRQIERLAPLARKRLLEVGCGEGRLSLQYASRVSRALAIDLDPIRVASAKQAAALAGVDNIDFQLRSALRVKPQPATFDTAIFTWSL